MASRRKADGKPQQVVVEHAPEAGAEERLGRAFALILEAEARAAEAVHEQNPQDHGERR